ncbi:MAG TPA: methylated-DNA--[protein]-cysteine S-methyltransferase, partial [Candidatus Peribacteria bacterium]|nr:methylated-DNA--[protein]-cysteine S-methyltransferase [Candidatus Peribacteria bacterium]
MKTKSTRMPSPIGTLEITATETHIRSVSLARGKAAGMAAVNDPLLGECVRQLKEYFDGKRENFELPLDPEGTPFQKLAWFALTCIERGKLASYGQVARAIGKEKAMRAVGTACKKNPILLMIPCHRVIAGNGRL